MVLSYIPLAHGSKLKYISKLPRNLTLENESTVVNYRCIFIALAPSLNLRVKTIYDIHPEF